MDKKNNICQEQAKTVTEILNNRPNKTTSIYQFDI